MSGYGNQTWPYNLDGQPIQRSMIGGMHHIASGVDGATWAADGWLTEDNVTDEQGLFAHAVRDSALRNGIGGATVSDSLLLILAELASLPASGTSLNTLLDETLVIGAGLSVTSSIYDTSNYESIMFWMVNTGGQTADSGSMTIYSGAAGAGIPFTVTSSPTIPTGAIKVYDILQAWSAWTMQSTKRQPVMFRSASITVGSTNGTSVRVIVLGRKPWARD